MPKRKEQHESSDDDEGDEKIVNVDFEFFDLRPQVDYVALKRLLQQLFHADAHLFHLEQLADLILSQPLVGSTVKTDGIDSDPFAFLTVLNMHVHREHPSIQAITQYILKKIAPNAQFMAALENALASTNERHLGLIIGERVYNMPPQVIPPMYRMLQDEVRLANEDKEPYEFDNYLILSRIWRWTADEIEAAMEDVQVSSPPTKKRKQAKSNIQKGVETHTYHPEDICIQQVASHSADYDFSKKEDRGPEAFGTDIGGRVMLVPSLRLPKAVAQMAEKFAA